MGARRLRDINASEAEVREAVRHNTKQRFEIQDTLEGSSGPFIRATQGHSITVNRDLIQERVTGPSLPRRLYHATFFSCYESIRRSGIYAGGPRGTRQDVHFTAERPGDRGQRPISGMRSGSDIALEICTRTAEEDGCIFYKSKNQVYLTAGSNGAVSPKCIRAVLIVATQERVPADRADSAPSRVAVGTGEWLRSRLPRWLP